MAEPKVQIERPLSPHLGIYRFSITMAMSIVHRITGGALYFGTLLLVWWLLAASSSAKQFDIVSAFFAYLVAAMQGKYYAEIITPGALVGLIVGYAAFRHHP